MTGKFRVGDKVSIPNDGGSVREYEVDDGSNSIPGTQSNGSVVMKDEHDGGKVVGVYKELYLVSYIDEDSKEVILGWRENKLEPHRRKGNFNNLLNLSWLDE